MKLYKVIHFKRIPGTREVYGAKEFVGTLDRACKRLVKMYGRTATVRVICPGRYSIADDAAEMAPL